MNRMDKIKITVEAAVNPTEDVDKVKIAVHKVLGEIPLQVLNDQYGARLFGRKEGLKALVTFRDLLRRELILDAARRVLFSGLRGDTITFYLNKQVAYVGHVSFSQPEGESPLGPIRVDIQCDNPRALINWLAPKTAQR